MAIAEAIRMITPDNGKAWPDPYIDGLQQFQERSKYEAVCDTTPAEW
jgi:hypothetical protein